MYGHAAMMQTSEQIRGDKMTVKQTREFYFNDEYSDYTIRDWARRKLIPHAKIGGRLIFSRSELDRFFQEKMRQSVMDQGAQEYGKLRMVAGK